MMSERATNKHILIIKIAKKFLFALQGALKYNN
jgi:hypothetical protein